MLFSQINNHEVGPHDQRYVQRMTMSLMTVGEIKDTLGFCVVIAYQKLINFLNIKI